MSPSRHTPGPWKPIKYAGPVREITGATDVETRMADARLIVLAPEMLDKLTVALRSLEEKSDGSNRDAGLIESIAKLLARAEGGS